jgi:hypothetical protein
MDFVRSAWHDPTCAISTSASQTSEVFARCLWTKGASNRAGMSPESVLLRLPKSNCTGRNFLDTLP